PLRFARGRQVWRAGAAARADVSDAYLVCTAREVGHRVASAEMRVEAGGKRLTASQSKEDRLLLIGPVGNGQRGDVPVRGNGLPDALQDGQHGRRSPRA